MGSRNRIPIRRHGEHGATLFIFTMSMFLLIGMGALAIDLASMYVARNESQQAADAAALAGAKYFVESGCVTAGNCATFETTAIARATQVTAASFVEGTPAIMNGTPTFDVTKPQNPQITVKVQSDPANPLHLYFLRALVHMASIVGAGGPLNTSITVGATATAEAWNPSGIVGGPTFCTGCVRPWLIPNCFQILPGTPPSCVGNLLDPSNNYAVLNSSCATSGGIIGEPIQIAIETQPTLYAAVDDGTGNVGYQNSIVACNTDQKTCGATVTTLPGPNVGFTVPSVDNLLHLPGGTTGAPPPAPFVSAGQDTIVTTTCPPQIQAGALNPLVFQGVISPAGSIVATSDSIITAYIYDWTTTTPLIPGVPQAVTIRGFAQIFITQVDTNGDVEGVILGVAGCGSNAGTCGKGAGSGTSINGSTMIPVRLIAPAN